MQYKLGETIAEGNKAIFDFVGFDDWRDFIKIMNIIRGVIKPQKSDYQGVTDMNGYFEKDGLCLEVQYDEMIGNYLEFKGEQTEDNLAKIREWTNIIFKNLMVSVEG